MTTAAEWQLRLLAGTTSTPSRLSRRGASSGPWKLAYNGVVFTYARGQTGQQLPLGAYQALERQIAAGTVSMFPRQEMLDLIVSDDGAGAGGSRARGIVVRDLSAARASPPARPPLPGECR